MPAITRRRLVWLSGSAPLSAVSGHVPKPPSGDPSGSNNCKPRTGGGSDSATRPFIDRLSGKSRWSLRRAWLQSGREIAGRRLYVSRHPVAQRRYCAASAQGAIRSDQRPRAGHSVHRGNTSRRRASLGAQSTRSRSLRPMPNKSRKTELGLTRRRHVRPSDL